MDAPTKVWVHIKSFLLLFKHLKNIFNANAVRFAGALCL